MKLLARRLAAVLIACVVTVFPAAAQTVVTLYSQYNAPQYVAVDANKTVFVTDTTNSLSALGLVTGGYATTPTAYDTNFATLYESPTGVAVGPDGQILSVSMASSVPGFFFLWDFAPPNYAEIEDGSLPNSGGAMQGVAADSQGNFYVGDTNGTVVKIFAPDYQAATSFATGQSGTDHPYGIAFDSHDNLFVADQLSGSGQILEYAPGPVLVNTITSGNLQEPTGVAVDRRGNLYVADSAANTLTEFAAPDFANAQVIVNTGLSGPMGVAVDADDNIFIVDTGHNALKEVLALPAVTALAASAGPLGGGTVVTITGVHLTGTSAVSFGGTAASSFTAVSDTEVTATAPAGSVGPVDVRVTTPNGISIAASVDVYSYTAAPAVSSVSAASGSTAGGNSVTINGTNLANASAVSFGGTPAAGFSVLGQTQIGATVPPGTAGQIDVRVTTPGGTSATGAGDRYTYVAQPVVSGITPAAGPTAGGTTVTIGGVHLTGTSAIAFGGTAATSFTVVSDTQITVTAPAGAAGTVDVKATTSGGTSATSAADGYTYLALPMVSAISPTAGPVSGGTPVTITGTNLAGATAVGFGGTAALGFTIDSATQITATAPAGGAGTVADITVTTPAGTSADSAADHYTYTAGPAVTALSPARGPIGGGTPVTITGANLAGATAVTFGATAATGFTVVSATEITATAPAGSVGAVDVTVTTPRGTSPTSAADAFTYVAAPAVSALSPNSGSTTGGTSVVITGTSLTGASGVSFGSTVATVFTVNSATQITAVAPAGTAGTVDVTVTTIGGTSTTGSADNYTYRLVPVVSAVSPVTGRVAGGNTVTIAGANLAGATAVKFGTSAASFTVNGATQITATAPAGAAGTVDVTVTTPDGTSAVVAADQYTYGNGPAVAAVSPATGPLAGGNLVTITGANLTGATSVRFGTTQAAGFTVNSASQITAAAPAGTAGTVDVTVTTPVATSTVNAGDHYTYGTAPSIASVSPNGGPVTGGTLVTITGANLTGATAVSFGVVAASSFAPVSASQVTAVAPAGAPGTVDITVATPLGTSATSVADGYTYRAGPTVTAVTPPGGPVAGGNSVTITGNGLIGATSVKFGAAAARFTVVNAGQIMATVPAGSAGTVDVVVTTPDGTSPTGSADHYSYTALPVIGGITPSTGGTAGGTAVTITGSNLGDATAVLFGTAPATHVTTSGAGQVIAVSPPGATGTVDVIVATGQGSSTATAADRFTYTSGTAGQAYAYQSTLGVTGTPKPDNSHFNGPIAGAVDTANGHLLIADTGNDRVQVLDSSTLAVVATIGTSGVSGNDDAHLNAPLGVDLDPATGHILVADTGNSRIQIFDAKSFVYASTLGGAGQFSRPAGVRLNPTTRELYVADTGNNQVQVFDADSLAPITTLGTGIAGNGNTQLNQPLDAVLDPSTDEILVADSGNSRIQRFEAATLAYAGTIGGATLGQGDNDYVGAPASIAFDPSSDLVLVADSGPDSRVQVFDALTYGYVLTLGTTGSSGAGNAQFASPAGIAVDPPHARLFIGDRLNDRVQVFTIGAPALFASILPGSRTVELGTPATVFASMINAGTAPVADCRPALTATAPAGLSLDYQTTNAATNALTGTPDSPAAIAGNDGVQSFLLTFQGTALLTETGLPIDFDCAGVAPAAVETGVDTLDLALSSTPVADIIALAATPSGDGIARIPVGGIGAFAVASSNVGAASLIVASVDTGAASLPLTATICQSNPANGQCLSAPAASVTLSIAAGAAPTFSVFVQDNAPVALDPATSRIFLRFKDAAGGLHGSTSVAVATD
jgi:YVTN family beta-propeller protein